jgi:hypothetical protein
MGGDGDHAGASVTIRGSAPRGAGDRESDLLVAAVADAPDAPQCRDREICKLSVFSASFIRPLSWDDLLIFDLDVFLSRQLKCALLVPAKAPLPEEAIFNQNQAQRKRGALRIRPSIRSARSPGAIATTTATRGGRRGSRASPPMRIHRPSRRGAVTSPTPRSTGSTCRGRPRLHRSVALNCRRRAGRGRRGVTRLWARAHIRWLLLPVWACGQPAPVRAPPERALPSCRDLRPVRSIPRGGRRSDRCPSAGSMMARTVRTPTPCRGACRGGGRRIRR